MPKVTDLPNVGTLTDSDVLPVVDGEGTPGSRGRQVTASQVRDYLWTDGDTRYAAKGTTETALNGKVGKGDIVINVKDAPYNAKGDGATNDRDAIQAAIDAVSARGGGTVWVPNGTYIKPGSSAPLVPKSNVTIQGESRSGVVILRTDTGSNPLIRTTTIGGAFNNFAIKSLTLRGDRASNLSSSGLANPEIWYGTDVLIEDVAVEDARFFGLGVLHSNRVRVLNCSFKNINRDGLFCWNTSNLVVTGCHFEGVNDDAISVHTDESAPAPLRSQIVIANNTFFRSQGVKCLGPKNLTIANNTMSQMLSYGITAYAASNQGDTAGMNVQIVNNTISDVILRQESGALNQEFYYIRIGGPNRNAATGANAPPGMNDTVNGNIVDLFGTSTGHFWNSNEDATGVAGPGSYWWRVSGNILTRTLPAVSAVEDWGYGTMQVGTSGTFSGAIPESALNATGLAVEGQMKHVLVSSNIVQTSGRSVQFYGFGKTSTIPNMSFINVCFDDNVFADFKDAGLYWPTASVTYQDIKIRRNLFDGDPRHVSSNRGTNGTWLVNNQTPCAIRMGNAEGCVVTDNQFKNVCTMSQHGSTGQSFYKNNLQRCDPVAAGFSTSNKGIGQVETGSDRFILLVEDSDPASTAYGQVLNACATELSSIPTTGKFVQGHFIKVRTYTVAAGKVHLGWCRLTTGSGHTVGTDWSLVYGTTS